MVYVHVFESGQEGFILISYFLHASKHTQWGFHIILCGFFFSLQVTEQ